MPAKRPRQKKIVRFLVFFMVLAASFFAWRLVTEAVYFKVSRVEVEGDTKGLVSDKIYEMAIGHNLVIFPEDKIRSEVAKTLMVDSVTFEKKFPSTVLAKVKYREPVMTWQSHYGRYLVDKSGVAYQPAGGESLPQVSSSNSEINLGDRLSRDEIELTLKILDLGAGSFNVLTINFKGSDVRIQLSSGSEVIINDSSNPVQIQETLQLILAQAKIEGRLPRQIDLRYSKPIVNY